MQGAIKFYMRMAEVAIYMALMGQAKDFVLVMADKAHEAQKNRVSYSSFTRQMTGR